MKFISLIKQLKFVSLFNKFKTIFAVIGVVALVYMIAVLFLNFMSSNLSEIDEYVDTSQSFMSKVTHNPNDPLKVTFKTDMVSESVVGTNEDRNLISIRPDTPGTLTWTSQRSLIFYPKEQLQKNKKYKVTLRMNELFSKESSKSSFKPITFDVEMMGQVVNRLDYNWNQIKNDKSETKLKGELVFLFPIDQQSVEKGVVLDKKGIEVPLTIQSVGGSKNKYSFTSDIVNRGTDTDLFTLKLSKQHLEIKHSIKKKIPLNSLKNFQAFRANGLSTGNRPSIKIDFSDPLKSTQDLRGLIEVKDIDSKDLSFSINDNSIIVNGPFKAGFVYQVSVLNDIQSEWGYQSQKKAQFTVNFNYVKPQVKFVDGGYILPSSNNGKLLIETINVKRVTVTVHKINDEYFDESFYGEENYELVHFLTHNNIIMEENNGTKASTSLTNYELLENATKVISQTIDIDNYSNSWLVSEIDFNDYFNSEYDKYNGVSKNGIYIVTVNFSKSDIITKNTKDGKYDLSNNQVQKGLVFSDISLTIKESTKDITVIATDIVSGEPISDLDLSLYHFGTTDSWSRKVEKVSRSKTNEKGIVSFPNIKDSSTFRYISGKLLIAKRDDERIIVSLNNANLLWNTATFDTGGIDKKDINAFIYTDRGVYRPGSTIYLSSIIRGNIPDYLPAEIKVFNPKRQLVHEAINNSGIDGFYSFEIPTKLDAMTGTWKVLMKVGYASFSKQIKVETIVPYKLKINTSFTNEELALENNSTTINIQSNYLMGNPANGNQVKVNLTKHNIEKKFPNYPGYTFINQSKELHTDQDTLFEGKLSSDGKVSVPIKFIESTAPPSTIQGKIVTEVLEKGGRPVRHVSVLDYEPYSYYVGIENLENESFRLNETIKIKTLYVSKDGQPEKKQVLNYKIYKNEKYWWWEILSNSKEKLKFKTNSATFLVKEGRIESGINPENIEFMPEKNGVYLLEVSSQKKNGHISSQFFRVGKYGNAKNREDAASIVLKPEETSYEIGDVAVVTFPAPPNSNALVTIERNNEILTTTWVKVPNEATEGIFEFEVTDEMDPNIYVTVSVIQPHLDTKNDLPIRTYGITPISIKNSLNVDNFTINAPKKILPKSTFKVAFQSEYKKRTQFTIAVVDEGLLDITDFKTPNPDDVFRAKQKLNVKTFDLFSQVIGLNKGDVFKSFSIGGSDSLVAKQNIASKIQRFKPIAFFKGPIKTDSNGFAEVEFEIPNYVGSVRILAVSADGDRYGSNARTMVVASPLSVISTIPRTLKVGDTFEISSSILTDSKQPIPLNININSSDRIEISSAKDKIASVSLANEGFVTFAAVVKSEIGTANIEIKAVSKSGDKSFIDKKEFEIKVPIPHLSKLVQRKKGVINKKQSLDWVLPESKVKGADIVFVSLSTIPNLSLGHRLDSLVRYPYGCIEQTTSSVFPQLYLSQLFDNVDQSKIDDNINAGIDRLNSFLTRDGGFAYWPGGNVASDWGTNYAGHFLILAKRKGYDVPNHMFNSWLNFQKNNRYTGTMLTQIYRAYLLSLAGDPDFSTMNRLYSEDQSLKLTEKWLLAAAYKLSGSDSISESVYQELLNDDNFDIPEYIELGNTYGSTLRDKAIILASLLDLSEKEVTNYNDKRNELIDTISDEISADKWHSTQTLGYSLLALGRYINESNLSDSFTVDIEYNDKKDKLSFTSDQVIQEVPIKKGFGLPINITTNSDTDIFAQINWEGVPDLMKITEVSEKLDITRQWFNEEGKPININTLKKGDSFWIYYKVEKENLNERLYELALSQLLPSGWEIDNTRLSQSALPNWMKSFKLGNEEYLDIRDDSVSWFFDMSSTKEKDIEFVVKISVVSPGSYILPPTIAEAMYDNTYKAILPPQKVVVK